MQLRAAALDAHLAKELAPAYLVSGDETLLVEEACDAILATARSRGFGERSVLHVDAGFHWHDVTQGAASLSLFSERRVIDVRNPAAKFDKDASDVLRDYCAAPAADTLLLIRCARIDSRQRTSAWFKALDDAGVVLQIWPVTAAELPRWLDSRIKRAGLALTAAALDCLAERVEGNLLAAMQEIEKLKLASLDSPIDLEALNSVLEDASRYDTFELLDAVFLGEPARVARMVRGLRAEGVAVFAVLGALGGQLRLLQGGTQALGRLPPHRRRALERFGSRLGRGDARSRARALDLALAECALVDQQGKGQLLGDAWHSLEDLLARLAGARLTSLEDRLPYLIRP